MAQSYAQYCGLAKALDHVGDRWTLLIVRELLISPRRFSDLRRALPRIATNLLADRLRRAEQDGILHKVQGRYALTAYGRELEGVVEQLVRWGRRWMVDRDPSEAFEPEWLVVALRALLPARRHGTILLTVEGGHIAMTKSAIVPGRLEDPDATVEATADQVLGAVTGKLPLSRLKIRGDRILVETSLKASGLDPIA